MRPAIKQKSTRMNGTGKFKEVVMVSSEPGLKSNREPLETCEYNIMQS